MTEMVPEFLAGGGEMGERIRAFNWAGTPLGPVHTWPQSLRTCVRIMLTSRQPMWIGWGPQLIKLYNDAYKEIVRGKHPWALGTPASQVWKDIWETAGPIARKAMEQNEGSYFESQLLIMHRNGYPEETYYTYSYTPIPGDEGRTEGIFCANTDDTDRIIGDRQLKTLSLLGAHLAECTTNQEVIDRMFKALDCNPHDITFSAFYTIAGDQASLARTSLPALANHTLPENISLSSGNKLPNLMRDGLLSRKPQQLEQPESIIGPLPTGAWKLPPPQAILLPIQQAGATEPYGILIVGQNPHRLYDDKYSSFLSLLADQVTSSFANVHALEEERKRTAALAEIDRAKTTFFSNISHEFRTPLTLLMGPMEEILRDPTTLPHNRERVALAHRNALRMQKLVNTLLEFSRIEAGRIEGRFTRVDIGLITAELAGTFRSAIEKAGMSLEVSIEPIEAAVYVDLDMWERIILNLISNAFKYSNDGKIIVAVKAVNGNVQVSVTDQGIGIEADQLDKIFDRFYRVENTGGRSQEGTGIGLAMVKELVRLHQGNIQVWSEKDKGSTFTVYIPAGKQHLHPDRITEAPVNRLSQHSAAFVEEAGKWNHEEIMTAQPLSAQPAKSPVHNLQLTPPKVLLADDNADMREYVQRLLCDQFQVITANDGEDAWHKIIQHQPDLIVSDIMMPRLDGLGLLKKIRSFTHTRSIPVIFLSARAGEEAKIEGMQTGADDYLVKPFSARELVAKVEAHIRMAESRRETEKLLRNFFMQAPAAIAILQAPAFVYTLANPQYQQLFHRTEEQLIGRSIEENCTPADAQRFQALLTKAYINGTQIHTEAFEAHDRYYDFVIHPITNGQGTVTDLMLHAYEVTDKVAASKKAAENTEKLEAAVRQRTRELQRSNDDLLQFAHVASHDLKEPVRKIRTFGKRLQDEYSHDIPEKGQVFLDKLLNASDRMIAVIEGILSYSAISNNEQPNQSIDLNNIIRLVESDLELLIQQKDATIETNTLPVIQGNSTLIHQLFYNLVQNALKFAKTTGKPHISIKAQIVGLDGSSEAHISVTDNGIGFDAQYADRIFETFARLNPVNSYEGTGLGLALCKKIVERHHGTIKATGKQQQGAEFYIILPVHTPNSH